MSKWAPLNLEIWQFLWSWHGLWYQLHHFLPREQNISKFLYFGTPFSFLSCAKFLRNDEETCVSVNFVKSVQLDKSISRKFTNTFELATLSLFIDCGYIRTFVQLRFYVKSYLRIPEVPQNCSFDFFWGPKLTLWWFFAISES